VQKTGIIQIISAEKIIAKGCHLSNSIVSRIYLFHLRRHPKLQVHLPEALSLVDLLLLGLFSRLPSLIDPFFV